MKKDGKIEGSIQSSVKKSNKNLAVIIIIILVLLIAVSLLIYLIGNYLKSKPAEINETDENITDTEMPSQNQTTPPTNQTTNESDDDDGGGGGGSTCTTTCSSLGYECGNFTICGSLKNCGICGTGKRCVSGKCEETCEDECNAEGLFCDKNMTYNCSEGDDGCFDRTNLTLCGTGYQCVSGQCAVLCEDECDAEGLFCDGNANMPYNCTKKSDGCFDRTNITECTTGYQCVSGACQIIPSCNNNSDCVSFTNTCSVGICNTTGKCEVSYNSTNDLCKASNGVCDTAEYCSGNSGICPADIFNSTTDLCRDSNRGCDIVEYCSGSSAACPSDDFRSNTYVCRASAGECDIEEKCTGTSADCPNNIFNISTTVCRASAGECDVAENCSGNSAACPINMFMPDGTYCTGGTCSGGVCTGCTPNCAGKECGSDGCGGTCPPGCNAEETCNNGVCVASVVCGNNDAETGEVCDGTDLNGQTCQGLGYDGGTLSCSADCHSFNTSRCYNNPSNYLIADHTAVQNFNKIPDYWLAKAKELTVHYGHTSHGSQVVCGLNYLEKYIDPVKYKYNTTVRYSNPLVLPARENPPALRMAEIGAHPEDYWQGAAAQAATTQELSSGLYNISGWSWCGEHGDTALVQEYIQSIALLESQSPNVKFFYMTGASSPYRAANNELIRQYVKDNNKILFDFEDIELYSPDGVYQPGYDGQGLWCDAWVQQNPNVYQNIPLRVEIGGGGEDWLSSSHAHGLFTIMKGKAFWWMMARLSGWDGTPKCPEYHTCPEGTTCSQGICVPSYVQEEAASMSLISRIWNWIKNPFS